MPQATFNIIPHWHLSEFDLTQIRGHLRHMFETKASRARDVTQMAELWVLSETADDVDPALIEAYASVFEDLREVRIQRGMIAAIGLAWHPRSASEFLTSFISATTRGHDEQT